MFFINNEIRIEKSLRKITNQPVVQRRNQGKSGYTLRWKKVTQNIRTYEIQLTLLRGKCIAINTYVKKNVESIA